MRQITDVLGVCLNSTRRKEQWTCLRRDKHQELYAKRTGQGINNGSSVYYLAVNEASCGIEEAYDLLHSDSTAQFRLMTKLLHGRDVTDGTLHSIRTKKHARNDGTMDTHHAVVSFVYQDHRKSVLQREQHLTFFQTLKLFLPENQHEHHNRSTSATSSFNGLHARPSDEVHKRTIALSWLPFPRSHEAMLETAFQVDLQYTLIVEEISANRLRLSCVTSSYHDENDGPLAGSPRVARAIARRLALRSVGRLEAAVAASRIGDCAFVAPHQWVKNQDRVSCVICWKRFHPIVRRRHHCRLCGEVICGSCGSLRNVSVFSFKTKDVQKTRMCHLCYNKARLKATTRDCFDQSNQDISHVSPLRLASEVESEAAFLMQVLPASKTGMADHAPVIPPPSVDVFTRQESRAGKCAYESDCFESGGYIGALPGRGGPSTTSKIISIKSMTRSATTTWQAIPFTSSSKENVSSYQGLNVNSAEGSNEWENGRDSGFEAADAGYDSLWCGRNESRSFLHPVAMALQSRRLPHPIAGSSSCSSADRSFLSSYCFLDSKEHEDEYMERLDCRRTSVMSSNVGLLDQDSITDESYFVPKLDTHCEKERLKLMEVIVSPACTLVDRTLMHQSCDLAAAAFGVKAAFIARVDNEHILIEHAIGIRELSPQDKIVRRDSLVDFVLCQPPYQPWVVLDCLVDPRTREIPMVQHLRMRFFIGISVCVRGLPIACLCAYGQDSDDQSEKEQDDTRASFYDSSIILSAAQRMENELEILMHGLEV